MTLSAAGTVRLGDLTVPRLGYGTMRLTGPGIWGRPSDHDEALAVLRRAVELGITMIDTAWYYGPDVANQLVREALAPYPDDLVFVTKLGGARGDDASWRPALTPEELRQGCETDLRQLGVESVPVVHLRWLDDGGGVPFADAVGTMVELQDEGKVQRIGLSNVSSEQLDAALAETPVVSVSNNYSIAERGDDPMVDRCASEGIAYLPFFPLLMGDLERHGALVEVATRLEATPAQVALAWLLARSPTVAPIPGTSRVAHLEENVAAADLVLDDAATAALR